MPPAAAAEKKRRRRAAMRSRGGEEGSEATKRILANLSHNKQKRGENILLLWKEKVSSLAWEREKSTPSTLRRGEEGRHSVFPPPPP